MKKFYQSLYFSPLFYIVGGALVLLFIVGYLVPALYIIGLGLLTLFPTVLVIDIFLLYQKKTRILGRRDVPNKFSNGDDNPVVIYIDNLSTLKLRIKVIDEAPDQFQRRDIVYTIDLHPGESRSLFYNLRPTKRGEYIFGNLNVYISSPLNWVQRRYKFSHETPVAVYPSFIQMRKYELLAMSNRLTMAGVKKIRRIGQNREFDQIREYVRGDDPRHINWKATARKNALMSNQYTDEKAQPVYSVIDMGRLMKSPFHEMTLLDYSINAALVISNIAILKSDKAGIITFSHKTENVLKAERTPGQMRKILELLYRIRTGFLETNYQFLYHTIRRKVNQRSLLLLYTNFESVEALKRQLPYFQQINKSHLLVVIIFMNTELKEYVKEKAKSLDEIYLKTIGAKFVYEKRQIVKELHAHGIQTVLTTPENLTVNTINKYLELKARGMF